MEPVKITTSVKTTKNHFRTHWFDGHFADEFSNQGIAGKAFALEYKLLKGKVIQEDEHSIIIRKQSKTYRYEIIAKENNDNLDIMAIGDLSPFGRVGMIISWIIGVLMCGVGVIFPYLFSRQLPKRLEAVCNMYITAIKNFYEHLAAPA